MAISRIGRALTNPEVELPPKPAPPPPKPSAPPPDPTASAFEAARRNPMCLNPSEGRGHGTNDDSVGRGSGTNDDSIGRGNGTNDDSIGRGNGTNDDSIGGPSGSTATTSRDLEAVAPSYTAAVADHDSVGELSSTAQGQVQKLLANPKTARAADYALRSETFASLAPAQREKFIDVMARGDEVTVRLMAISCEKAGDLYAERASDGSTMLDNLQQMASASGAKQFLNHTLADVIRPERIWQGDAPTCTVSTMQYELAQEKPAEYARIMTGLTVVGSARLAGGGVIETQVGDALMHSILSKDRRSPTEAVFQSAAMEFANGADTYDLAARRSTHANGDGSTQTYRGLYGEQIRGMVGQLFGIEYTTTRIENNEQAAAALATLNRSNVPNRPVLVDLVINDKQNHCVAFEGFSKGRVYFRDPQTGKKDSISEQQFLETAAAVHVAPLPVPKPRPKSPKLRMMEDIE